MLVGMLLLQLVFQATFQDFLPLWSDELWYWHQAKTFTAVGWDNGYYTAAELTPSADWSRYYAWGPYVVMFYSLFDRLFSLQLQSILYINLVLLTILPCSTTLRNRFVFGCEPIIAANSS